MVMARKKGSKNVSADLKNRIIDLLRSGMTRKQVAGFYDIPLNTVKSIIRRRNKEATNKNSITKQGRKRLLGPRCVRRLLNFVRKNNKQPLFYIAANFKTIDGSNLSQKTIKRYLHRNGIRSYIAASKPYLTSKHIAARLNWCITRQQWSMQQWKNVAFSDESSFTLKPIKNHSRVWRLNNTRYANRNMVPTFKSGFVSLSVWGLFSSKGRSPLIRITGTLNQHKYIEILKQYVLPFKAQNHSGSNEFIFQHDGCGPHRAKNVSLFLEAEGIAVLPWPAQSPDLNPIENVWSVMKRNLRKLPSYPSTADDLFSQLCFIWDNLPNDYFDKLIGSMKSRCIAVANVRGGASKY